MNILFLTMVKIVDIKENGIYTDLMRRFRKDGHEVYIVCPYERREGKPTSYKEKDGFHTLSVKTLNVQKTNVVEKGLGLLSWNDILGSSLYYSKLSFKIASISYEQETIIACTDKNCDIGELAARNGYGYYCESDSVHSFTCIINDMLKPDRKEMGEKSYQFFMNNYTVDHSYNAIMQHLKK